MQKDTDNKKMVSGPVVLLIIDGLGIAPPSQGNAYHLAQTPILDALIKKYPTTQLKTYGKHVGLNKGQPGNSEAGHMNMGAGRIVNQEALRINNAIEDGRFFKNPIFIQAIRHVQKNNSALHLMGMLTQNRSGHADPDHLYALLRLARENRIKKVFLHLFTDGRDSPPHAALKLTEALLRELKDEWIATIMGRSFAMDRKKNWKQTQAAYDALVRGIGLHAESPQAAITESYNRNETDEFIPPYVLQRDGKNIASVNNKDAVIFFNFRSDRARQLTKVFVQKDFSKKNQKSFRRKKVLKNIVFVAMTDFGPDLDNTLTAYPSIEIHDTLAVALKGQRQLYICESEKYAHVNYFFNGGYPDPVANEKRIKIPSPNVISYAQTPAMSTKKISDTVLKNINKYDFFLVNFANVDMIGHTGNLQAAVLALEVVDYEVQRLKEVVLRARGALIITSDHGNAEYMLNPKTKEVVTEHTSNPVGFTIVSNNPHITFSKGPFSLSSVAPTVLRLFGKKIPKAMTSKCIIKG
jgi:2,3-bisphosphoglycerate-independent phosphoglycerate mutase